MMLSVGTGAGGAGSSTMSSGGGGNVSAATVVDAVGSSDQCWNCLACITIPTPTPIVNK